MVDREATAYAYRGWADVERFAEFGGQRPSGRIAPGGVDDQRIPPAGLQRPEANLVVRSGRVVGAPIGPLHQLSRAGP